MARSIVRRELLEREIVLEETNHFRIVGWLVYSLLLVCVYTRMALKGFLNYCCVA